MPTALASEDITRARRLRRDMTDGERKLWEELRQFRRWYGIHVRKQVPFGIYVADFAIHDQRMVIEVDGEHHFEPERMVRDRRRDEWFAKEGYEVLRFTTGDIADSCDGCVEVIPRKLGLMKEGDVPFPLTPPRKVDGDRETS